MHRKECGFGSLLTAHHNLIPCTPAFTNRSCWLLVLRFIICGHHLANRLCYRMCRDFGKNLAGSRDFTNSGL